MSRPPKPDRPPWDVSVLLLFLAGLLWFFQYATLRRFSVLKQGVRYPDLSDFIAVVRQTVPLTGWDGLWALLILVAVAALLVLELSRFRLTAFLAWVFRGEGRTRLILAVSCLVWVRFYFAPGQSSWVADTAVHNTYAWIASRSLASGEIPIWTNDLSTGTPFLQFYGFLFFYAVALFNLVIRDVFWSIKVVTGLAHAASGLTIYLFVRTLARSRRAAFLAGTAYVLSFWHTQQVLMMGRLPLSVFYALLPLPFYCFERLRLRRHPCTWTVAGGLALAGLIYTHPGYAFWAVLLLAAYIASRRVSSAGSRTAWGLAGIGLGLGLGAWLTVPLMVQTEGTVLTQGISMERVQDVVWQQLVSWSNFRVSPFGLPDSGLHWYGGYLGFSLLLIALSGAVLLLKRRDARRSASSLGVWLGLLAALVLVFGYRWPLLSGVPLYHAFNAGRYLLFVVFFLAAGVGVALRPIARACRRRAGATRVCTVLLVLVGLDLGPTTFQHPYMPTAASRRLVPLPEALAHRSENLPPGRIPGTRILFNTNTRYQAVAIGWTLTTTGIPVPQGLYNESTLAWIDFVRPLGERVDRLATAFAASGRIAPSDDLSTVLMGAHLLNARHLLLIPEGTGQVGYAELPEVGPVIVAPEAVPADRLAADPDSGARDRLDRLLSAMGAIDTERRACDRFLANGMPSPVRTGTRPEVRILSHEVENQRVQLRVETSADCFARLAYAHYPYLVVTVNGEPVRPIETAGGFLLLRLPGGVHDIVIRPVLSPLRQWLLALELGLLAACAWSVYRERFSA